MRLLDDPIVLDFNQLQPIKTGTTHTSDIDIEKHAAQGLALLYHFLEKLLNHVDGGMCDAQ